MVDPPSDDGEDLPEGAIEGREVMRDGPIARAIVGDQPTLQVRSAIAEQDRVELFPMGPAGFFGALGTMTSAVRELIGNPPATLAEADQRLEAARDSISDSRLPIALPNTPGIARGARPDRASQPVASLRVSDRTYELVILPDGIVFAFDPALTST